MNLFEKQYGEVQQLLHFNDFPLVLRRIIDFTLDTEDIAFYKKTIDLLNFCDKKPPEDALKDRLKISLEEVYNALKTKPQAQPELLATAVQLKKRYGSSSFALGPIDLKLKTGDIIGLVGENGNGKTTLLRTLCGELNADSGSLTYNFHYTDLYDLRSKLVYIPQRTETWYGSVMDNLMFTTSCYGYTPEENRMVTELTVARLGLRKFSDYKWKDLSSGYKMRFELARMLLRRPKLLLIDEPLANLDILAQQTVLEDFKNIAKSAFRPLGIILSSQQLYEVEKTSDQVVFLKQGVQKNLRNEDSLNNPDVSALTIELESELSQAELYDRLCNIAPLTLQFNGGTFIATFNEEITAKDFLAGVVQYNIPLAYFRDITHSTRRFFVS